MSDGEIDYSKYSLKELREAESGIDAKKYPKNFENLQLAIAEKGATVPKPQPEEESPAAPGFNPIFPRRIDGPEQIRKCLNTGASASWIVAVSTALFTSYSIFKEPILGLDAWAFVDVALFGLFGYGTFRGSRAAAIAALLLFGLNRYFIYVEEGKLGGAFAVLLLAMLITGIRGAFAHQSQSRHTAEAEAAESD